MQSKSPALATERVRQEIEWLVGSKTQPILAALDGPSGSGKSTLAHALAEQLTAAIVPSDDFYASHIPDREWDSMTVAARLEAVIDWRRLREEALLPLLAGEPARWRTYDFAAGLDANGAYKMHEQPVYCQPAPVILLDGAYSARPELSDLIDLSVFVDCPAAARRARLAAREDAGFLARWRQLWDPVEALYFSGVKPRSSFDLVVQI